MSRKETVIAFVQEKLGDTSLNAINTSLESRTLGYSANPSFIQSMVSSLPEIKQPKITIFEIHPSSLAFTEKVINEYRFVAHIIHLTLLCESHEQSKALKLLAEKFIPHSANISIKYIVGGIADIDTTQHYDLVIGALHNKKLVGLERKNLSAEFNDDQAKSSASFAIHKAIEIGRHIALITPKSLLHNAEYSNCRSKLSTLQITHILDFGEQAYIGTNLESIGLIINTQDKPSETRIISYLKSSRLTYPQNEITDTKYPNWLIYNNQFFKNIASQLQFDIFNVYRDRDISSKDLNSDGELRVLRSQNVPVDALEVVLHDDDSYVKMDAVKNLAIYRYLDHENAYLCPNLTIHPRLIKKPKGCVASGSLAIFTPKEGIELKTEDVAYFSSDEFRRFYHQARNYCTRNLNIDKAATFYFGIRK